MLNKSLLLQGVSSNRMEGRWAQNYVQAETARASWQGLQVYMLVVFLLYLQRENTNPFRRLMQHSFTTCLHAMLETIYPAFVASRRRNTPRRPRLLSLSALIIPQCHLNILLSPSRTMKGADPRRMDLPTRRLEMTLSSKGQGKIRVNLPSYRARSQTGRASKWC